MFKRCKNGWQRSWCRTPNEAFWWTLLCENVIIYSQPTFRLKRWWAWRFMLSQSQFFIRASCFYSRWLMKKKKKKETLAHLFWEFHSLVLNLSVSCIRKNKKVVENMQTQWCAQNHWTLERLLRARISTTST